MMVQVELVGLELVLAPEVDAEGIGRLLVVAVAEGALDLRRGLDLCGSFHLHGRGYRLGFCL